MTTILTLVSAILAHKYYSVSMRICVVHILLDVARRKGMISESEVSEIMEIHSLATADDQ